MTWPKSVEVWSLVADGASPAGCWYWYDMPVTSWRKTRRRPEDTDSGHRSFPPILMFCS